MRLFATAAAFSAALAATAVLTAAPAEAWEVTWLGHAGVVVQAKDGTTVLIDPWLQNPKFPQNYKLPAKVDAILVTHGHFDHAGSATELSQRYKAPIIGAYELVNVLQPKEGPEGIGGNVGGTITVGSIKVSIVPAVHSSSGSKGEYMGNPVGFVLQAPGERTLMHGGDTGLTHDFKAVRDVFRPQVAFLPIGGHFTLDPAQAAIAASYLKVGEVVPIHFGTFPVLKGTPAQLRSAAPKLKVRELVPGKTVTL